MNQLYYPLIIPQNYIIEEIFLGSIIINPNLFTLISPNINIDHLFNEAHQIIYRNLIKIKKKSIDIINLIDSLKETKTLHQIGGIQKIETIIKKGHIFVACIDIRFYINQIIQLLHTKYYRRLIIQYGYNIIALSYHFEISNQQLYNKASKYLNYIEKKLNIKNLDNLKELIGSIINNIIYKKKISYDNHIYSGFKELDILTNGFPNGDLVIIAGRPSMGKTSFAINITYNLLKYFYTKVCIFSLEMSTIQILHKLIAIGSNIAINDIISGQIHRYQWKSIQIICNELLKAKLYINDNSNISIDEIKNITKIIIEEYKNIIIIDYLQLIQTKDLNIESRSQELSYITRQLKILAQTLCTPIIVLSQLNRNIEKRINKKPLLSDLKEGGCLHYNVNININHLLTLNIKNISDQMLIKQYNGLIIKDKKQKISPYYKNITQIYIFNKYNFKFKINYHSSIIITDNHQLFLYDHWIEQQQMQENTYIIQYKHLHKLQADIVNTIHFQDYNLVYDISKNNYTNFICNQIVIHNSIEQDSDIIIMLYQNNNIKEENIKSKILDICISKNRNGPIGSFQIKFNTETTIFNDIINQQLNNII